MVMAKSTLDLWLFSVTYLPNVSRDTLVIQGKDLLPVLSSHDAKARDSRCGHFECRIVVFEFCHQCGRGSGGGELQIISRLARSRFSRLVLVRVQDFIEKAVAHVPWMDF
ncbi:hypothetical protein TNCV_2971111 [Trichonephila clavipes]|nr:hypothetical protein TNCV_2971111 [Trichonephila clavipes]